MSRPTKGTVAYIPGAYGAMGAYHVRVTRKDGTRPWTKLEPEEESPEGLAHARQVAKELSDEVRAKQTTKGWSVYLRGEQWVISYKDERAPGRKWFEHRIARVDAKTEIQAKQYAERFVKALSTYRTPLVNPKQFVDVGFEMLMTVRRIAELSGCSLAIIGVRVARGETGVGLFRPPSDEEQKDGMKIEFEPDPQRYFQVERRIPVAVSVQRSASSKERRTGKRGRPSTHYYDVGDGRKMTLSEISREAGIAIPSAKKRLMRGLKAPELFAPTTFVKR